MISDILITLFFIQVQGNKEIHRKITATETTEMEHTQKNQERVIQGKVVSALSQLSLKRSYTSVYCYYYYLFIYRNRQNHQYLRKKCSLAEHSNKIKLVLRSSSMVNRYQL